MVRLEKIKKNDGEIEAAFFPENSKQAGFIKVDILHGEIVERVDALGYEGEKGRAYFHHAKKRLLELAQKEPIPEKNTVMWY